MCAAAYNNIMGQIGPGTPSGGDANRSTGANIFIGGSDATSFTKLNNLLGDLTNDNTSSGQTLVIITNPTGATSLRKYFATQPI